MSLLRQSREIDLKHEKSAQQIEEATTSKEPEKNTDSERQEVQQQANSGETPPPPSDNEPVPNQPGTVKKRRIRAHQATWSEANFRSALAAFAQENDMSTPTTPSLSATSATCKLLTFP